MAAVLNHLWQSTLFALVVGLVVLTLRRRGAGVRHLLWMVASIKFLVPFALLLSVGERLKLPAPPPFLPMPAAIPFPSQPLFLEQMGRPFPEAGPVLATDPGQTIDVASILLAAWAAGSALVLAIWAWRWLRMRQVVRAAVPLPWPWPAPIRASATLLEPVLVGIWRPVLLLPASLPDHLGPAQIEAILAHEASHLRRRDNLTGAVHMLVEALFWFYPPVWWIGARLTAERERACDETVIRAGHDRETYARGLIEAYRLYLKSPLQCAAGASGSNLERRVEAIMTAPQSSPLKPVTKALLGAGLALAVASPVAAGILSPAGVPGSGPVSQLLTAPVPQALLDAVAAPTALGQAEQPAGTDIQPQVSEVGLSARAAVEPVQAVELRYAQLQAPGPLVAATGPRPIELAEARLAAQVPVPGDAPAPAAPANAAVATDPASLDRYAGYYQLTRYALLHIYRVGDGLRFAFDNAERDNVKLVPAGGATFVAPEYTRPLWEGPPKALRADLRQAESRITFMLDAGGNATGLVLRVLGQEWSAPKIERDEAFSVQFARNQRLQMALASPGTRDFLQRFLASVEAGAPDYSGVSPRWEASDKRDEIAGQIRSLGPMKRIFFVGVTGDGSDRYTAVFAHTRIDFLIPPLDADGKVPGLSLRPSIPPGYSSVLARSDQLGRVFVDEFLPKAPVPLALK